MLGKLQQSHLDPMVTPRDCMRLSTYKQWNHALHMHIEILLDNWVLQIHSIQGTRSPFTCINTHTLAEVIGSIEVPVGLWDLMGESVISK